jgi:nucleotide-binding universal stress UspA family protein
MLRRILVGLNGSEFSQAAMSLAMKLATRHSASLLGIGVVDVPHLTAPQPVPLGGSAFKEERDLAVVQAAHVKIDACLDALRERCGAVNLSWQVEKQIGDPVAILAQQAQRCDLLVVGKRHVPTEENEGVGHTLDQLLRHSPRPVLCVPAAKVDGHPALIAYDGSLQAARTLHEFVASGLAVDRDLYIAALGDSAQQRVHLAVDFLAHHDFAPQIISEPSATQPSKRLLEIAHQKEAGLLVLGCYGQPRLKEFFFGSVTKAILATTDIPLFLYH